jgi:putative hemolysin
MSSIITATCVFIFGYKLGVVIATLGTAFFIVILCEITPKLLAVKNTERAALFVGPVMEVFIKLFSPVIAVFSGSSDIIIKLLRIKQAKRSPLVTEEELRLMIEIGKEEGFVSDEEGKMLQRIFEFGDISVGQVMVPRERMVAVDIENSPEQLLNIFVEEGHARLPVYKKSTDNIVGIIYANDLLYLIRDKGLFILQDLMHEAYYVFAETKVSELLRRFQADNIQIAIVVDAHKRALGLVTLEDLIEEIVGKIEEKHYRRQSKK